MLPDSESFMKIIPPSAWDEKKNHSQLAGLPFYFFFFINTCTSHRAADAREHLSHTQQNCLIHAWEDHADQK